LTGAAFRESALSIKSGSNEINALLNGAAHSATALKAASESLAIAFKSLQASSQSAQAGAAGAGEELKTLVAAVSGTVEKARTELQKVHSSTAELLAIAQRELQ
jgi:hypothetical protein